MPTRDYALRLAPLSRFLTLSRTPSLLIHDLPEKLRLAGLAEFFGTVTYSFDVGAEKPDVRIFRRAVAEANAAEEQCVHVGDSFEADYLGARRAGLHAVLLQREGDPPAPCPWIRSLEGLREILRPVRSRP